jgi:lipopolysaccharide transport system permease protein
LLWFLAARDVRVRYKQTILGAAWAIVQPAFSMVLFTLIFGQLAGFERRTSAPYALVTLCGLLPWVYFATALGNTANSLVANQNLITKVYFPRLLIPLSAVLAGLVDLAVAFLVLGAMMVGYRISPRPELLALPLFVLFAIAISLGSGLWLSALNVRYRDVRYVVPFLTQAWLFLTPVAYPMSVVPERWRAIYGLNPMVGVVEGFRWAILGGESPSAMVGIAAAATSVFLVGGLLYFRRVERTFADVV